MTTNQSHPSTVTCHTPRNTRSVAGMRRVARLAGALSVVLLAAGPALADDDGVLATYSGKKFTVADFQRAVEGLNPRARRVLANSERRQQYVENHILSELMYEAAKKEGIHEQPEVRTQLEQLERQILVQRLMQDQQDVEVSDEAVRAYYDENKEEFTTDRLKASHILVEESELAQEILGKLAEDSSQFAELAKAHSIDRTNAERGGDLGFFGKGRMVKEFEEAAFGLETDGQISGAVKTRFGYHIIQRVEREDGKLRPFGEVQNQIRVKMTNDARREKRENFMETLKKEAELTVNNDAVAAIEMPDAPEKGKKGKKDE